MNHRLHKDKASNVFRRNVNNIWNVKIESSTARQNIAISELKKLIDKCTRKSVDTKFDKPSVVRQPNAQRIPKPSLLGKPAPFSNSLKRTNFAKKKSVSKTNESEGLSKPVTLQNLPQKATQASVTACNNSLNSRTLNVNAVCATCGKYVFNANHDACVSKFLKDVNARTKKPNGVPINCTTHPIHWLTLNSTKHMTASISDDNFVEKYLGTVRFGNDQFCLNSLVLKFGSRKYHNKRVYNVEGTSSVNKSSSPTDNSNQQDTQPTTNIHPSTEPINPTTIVHAEENNDNQAADAHFEPYEFVNLFCTPIREEAESSPRNVDNSNMHTFYQCHQSKHRWTKYHPLEQVCGNPSRPMQTRR
ncbi:hypothetical protein Tco_0446192 [Tanacetum coccineum]